VICFNEVYGVVVDPGPTVCLPTVLDALGGEPPRAMLLTHVHLDHAGSDGAAALRPACNKAASRSVDVPA
jgi:glyoxylase-like metal-dependent hydrolase (beta-lactamase superfamily II)